MLTSEDIIHGDRFTEFADYAILENDSIIDGSQLQKDGLIFVKTDRIPEFFEIVRNLPFSYVIISHNSDHNITEQLYATKPKNVLHWFAQNCLVEDYCITPIPIGIERPCVSGQDTVQMILDARARNIKPIDLAYINFAWETNPGARMPVLEKWSGLVTHQKQRILFTKYLDEIQEHHLVFCPPGNGWDTHRLWETLYMDRVPIVWDSPFPRYVFDFPDGKKICTLDDLEKYTTRRFNPFWLKMWNWKRVILKMKDALL